VTEEEPEEEPEDTELSEACCLALYCLACRMRSSMVSMAVCPFLSFFSLRRDEKTDGTWDVRGLRNVSSKIEVLAKTIALRHSPAAMALERSPPNRMTEMSPSMMVSQMVGPHSTTDVTLDVPPPPMEEEEEAKDDAPLSPPEEIPDAALVMNEDEGALCASMES
jgi:hypothetical protein